MSITIHDSDALTAEQAKAIVDQYPDSEVVYVHGATIVWREQIIGLETLNPFQLDGYLDTVGVTTPRIALNMRDEYEHDE